MTTLTVGQNKQFSTIAAAVAASRDGDVVAVDAGTYVNDFATINTKITVAGVGGTAHLVSTVAPPNGKAIFVTNTDITLDRLEFSGTQVPDANGAGIRYQGGHLVITNSSFHDNQNGLLAADAPAGSITIRNTEFSRNGTGDGRTHNLYVGHVGTLTIENSSFHDAVVGHQIKSRADTTVIRDSHIYDGATGTGSYSIDLPNGGRAVLTGNLIEQGAASQNPVIVAFGEEGNVHPNSRLEMSGNTISNELVSVSTRLVWNATGTTAELVGNQVFGLSAGQYANGPVQISGMTVLAAKPVAAGLGVAATTPAAEVLPALVETAASAAAEVAPPAVVLPEPVAPALPVAAPAEPAVGDRPAVAPSEAEAAPLPVVTPPAPDPAAALPVAAPSEPAVAEPVLPAVAARPASADLGSAEPVEPTRDVVPAADPEAPPAEAADASGEAMTAEVAAPTLPAPADAEGTPPATEPARGSDEQRADTDAGLDPDGPAWERAFHAAIAAPPASQDDRDSFGDEPRPDGDDAASGWSGWHDADHDQLAALAASHDAGGEWDPNLAAILGGHGDFHYG